MWHKSPPLLAIANVATATADGTAPDVERVWLTTCLRLCQANFSRLEYICKKTGFVSNCILLECHSCRLRERRWFEIIELSAGRMKHPADVRIHLHHFGSYFQPNKRRWLYYQQMHICTTNHASIESIYRRDEGKRCDWVGFGVFRMHLAHVVDARKWTLERS